MEPVEILQALDGSHDVYQREAVQAAMERRDEVVPLLLSHLEQVLDEPERFSDSGYESNLALYAVVLLSHHRVREANRLLVDLASLPGKTPFDLFGDLIHEGFPVALWKTCGGDPAHIIRLVRDRRANEYCRISAIDALTYGVADRGLPRQEVVEVLQGLFTGDDVSREEYTVLSGAAAGLARIWPGESMDILRGAFEKELIDPFYIDLSFINDRLDEGKEARLAATERAARKWLDRTPHESLEWWACFNPDRPVFRGMPGPGSGPHGGASLGKTRRKSAEVRKKRKRARAERRKQRGKKRR
jgi:hypothetical protein